jgi:VWFA-related protein
MRDVTRGRRWAAAAAAILAVTWSFRSSGVARAQEPTRPTFPSEVELITVDAAVVDGKGQPVTDLTKDDFVVEEDGKPQPIVSFESVSVPAPSEGAPEPKAPPAATNVTTSTSARRAGRVFALIADDLRLPREQSRYLHQALDRFIDESLSPGDTVILGTTSDEAWWSTRIPDGREDLHRVVNRIAGRYVDPSIAEHMNEYEAYAITAQPHHVVEGGPADVAADAQVFSRVVLRLWDADLCGHKNPVDLRACWPYVEGMASTLDAQRRQRVARIVGVMGRTLGALPAGPGRASVLLFSAGFINDDVAQEVPAAALRSHTAVYFVDVRGLETGITAANERKEALANQYPSDTLRKQFEKLNLESSGAEALAEETGGFSIRNTNDLAAAGEKIAAESRTFYLLGIVPPPGKGRAEWRKLHVTVRRAGLTVRARRGYSVEAATGTGTSTRVPIPMRLASYVLQPTADATLVVAVAEVDMTGLASDLQMRLSAMPRDGGKTQTQDLSLHATANGNGWRPARVELKLPAGVYGLRAFLREPSSGRTGVVEQRLVVPEPTGFRLSTPVLTDSVAAPTGSAPAPLPIAHDELKSPADRPLLVSFEVFGATPEAGTGKPQIATAFDLKDSSGRSVATAPAALLSPSPDGRWQQMIALPALPNGDYALAITAQDRVAGTEQVERRAFKVVGGPEPKTPAVERAAAPTDGKLASLLERAGHYASAYESDFSNVVAEEDCHQMVRSDMPADRKLRLIKSAAFFVTVPGTLPWTTFRDVWEVDGTKIRNREQRLARLFQDSPADAMTRARAILDESNRYNLGPHRNVNTPTLALLFLLPENQRRFEFETKGQERIQGTMAAIVAFRERARPALVAGESADGSPATGRMWIDPDRGIVVKTDVTYDADPLDYEHKSQARVVTEYRAEPRLGLWVPSQMTETYSWPKAGPVEATTRYSEYRRFGVTTEESYDAAPEGPSPAPKQ